MADSVGNRRRHMTRGQIDRRKEVADEIHAEHPGMAMGEKMAIATNVAMGRKNGKGGRRR